MNKTGSFIFTIMLLFAGCAKPTVQKPENFYMGTIQKSDRLKVKNEGVSSTDLVGGAIGAVAGTLIGNQIGGGDGKLIATGAGAVGGAVAGAKIANSVMDEKDYHFETTTIILMDSGDHVKVVEEDGEQFRAGDRVKVGFSRNGEAVSIDFVEAKKSIQVVEREKIKTVTKDKIVYKEKKIYVSKPSAKSVSVSKTTDSSGKVVSTTETRTLNNVGDYGKAFTAVRE